MASRSAGGVACADQVGGISEAARLAARRPGTKGMMRAAQRRRTTNAKALQFRHSATWDSARRVASNVSTVVLTSAASRAVTWLRHARRRTWLVCLQEGFDLNGHGGRACAAGVAASTAAAATADTPRPRPVIPKYSPMIPTAGQAIPSTVTDGSTRRRSTAGGCWRTRTGARVRRVSRNEGDHTRRFRDLARRSEAVRPHLVLDGEVAIFDQQLSVPLRVAPRS